MHPRPELANLAVQAGLAVDELLEVLRRPPGAPLVQARALGLAQRLEHLGGLLVDELGGEPAGPSGPASA